MRTRVIMISLLALLAFACNDTSTNPVLEVSFVAVQIPGTMNVSFSPVVTGGEGIKNAYFWDFGDGVKSGEESPIHPYVKALNYIVKLSVCPNTNESSNKCKSSVQPVLVLAVD